MNKLLQLKNMEKRLKNGAGDNFMDLELILNGYARDGPQTRQDGEEKATRIRAVALTLGADCT